MQEDIRIFASVESTVIYSVASVSNFLPCKGREDVLFKLTTDTDSRIHHDDVVLMVSVKIVHQLAHLLERETIRIQSKHTSCVHVVNVCPHGLQRNVSVSVIVHHFGDFIDITIAISTVVELEYCQL